MTQLEKAQARLAIQIADAAEIARMADGGDHVAREDVEDALGDGALILDGLRRRPHYFDGRFLTGADLTRDQDYVRQRQADMARAGGAGVISGLQVDSFGVLRGQMVRIQPGVGLTPAGEVVMLTRQRDVPLLDLPLSRQLNAAMGLREEPRAPLGRRTGLFILALRPVEFTANPIAAYPSGVTGQRTMEDGDIIEATAITLIPYPDLGGAATLGEARRMVARSIFGGQPAGLPQEALPLAMIAVEGGAVRWLDMAMVRRETGADSGVHFAFGGRPRALAEAHILQHRAHLADVLDETAARGLPPSLAASQHFSLLPAAGQLPAAAIRPDDFGFVQNYFPPGVDVDIAFAPHDEIGALVEEATPLPPIDLAAPAGELDATAVVILVPVTRERFLRFENALPETVRKASADPANGGKPAFDALSSLIARRTRMVELSSAPATQDALALQAWRAALQEAVSALPAQDGRPPLLWYTRRRAVAWRSDVAGVAVAVSGVEEAGGALVNANIDRLKLGKRLTAINAQATPQGTARLMALLAAPAVAHSDILTVSVIADLERVAAGRAQAQKKLTKEAVGKETLDTDIPVLTRPIDVARLNLAAGGTKVAAASTTVSRPLTLNPTVLSRLEPASLILADARAGLNRALVSASVKAIGDMVDILPAPLGEGEVLDIAQDYSGPRLGEGLAALDRVLGEEWPDAKGVIWLGETGLALALDAALGLTPADRTGDFALMVAKAVSGQDGDLLAATIRKLG